MTPISTLVLAFATCASAAAAAAAAEQRYQLKAEDKNMFGFTYGSREGNAEYVVPFDKAYAQLTAAQQARLKSAYVEMGDMDEPPFPVAGLGAIYEPITAGQQRLHASGQFRADVEVNELGEPIAIAVYRSPSKSVTRFVSNVVMLTKFKPALCSGKPCKMGFPVRITFAMR